MAFEAALLINLSVHEGHFEITATPFPNENERFIFMNLRLNYFKVFTVGIEILL